MSIDAESLKKTMRTWVSGVAVITTSDGNERAGASASSFTSISVDPPLVLVSLQHHIHTFKLIEKTGVFAVSILRHDQASVSAQFAGQLTLPEGADKFYGINIQSAATGSPILADASAWLDCKVASIYEAGTSRIVVGEVIATDQGDDIIPLAYHNRDYFDLVPKNPAN